jgi:hypothetical protein
MEERILVSFVQSLLTVMAVGILSDLGAAGSTVRKNSPGMPLKTVILTRLMERRNLAQMDINLMDFRVMP